MWETNTYKLGELKEAVSRCSNKIIITKGWALGAVSYLRNNFDSDRGSYYDLAIDYTWSEDKAINRDELIVLLDKALKQGTMTGYKGGEFDITEQTYVKIGEYGIPGMCIESIIEEEDYIIFNLV